VSTAMLPKHMQFVYRPKKEVPRAFKKSSGATLWRLSELCGIQVMSGETHGGYLGNVVCFLGLSTNCNALH